MELSLLDSPDKHYCTWIINVSYSSPPSAAKDVCTFLPTNAEHSVMLSSTGRN